MFGRETRFEYAETTVGCVLLGPRLVVGWTFSHVCLTVVLDPGWSAEDVLLCGIPEGNPFGGVRATMAGEWLWLLDPLNAWA